jgi:hypothetical protein
MQHARLVGGGAFHRAPPLGIRLSFPDRAAAFRSITERIPFTGLTFCDLQRNDWVTGEHRGRLLDDALKTLA